jgi:hypothetical protein
MHSSKQGIMFARTDVGGAYRWQVDATGSHWVPMMDWVTRKDWNLWGIESVAVDPTDPQRVYLAAGTYTRPFVGNGVMLRSTDGGRTFERTNVPFKMGGNEDGRFAGERLVVDGAKNSILFFGSRNDGLWRSGDFGARWEKVGTFPITGKTNGVGIVFVLLNSAQMPVGEPTRVIYAGVSASPNDDVAGIYRSTDAGASWEKLKGQPEGNLMPNHAVLGIDGMMYVTYGNAPGPNGMTDGAVWKFNTMTGEWGEVTPVRPTGGTNGNSTFGYGSVTTDVQKPGTVMVATMDRWAQGDDVYRSTDGGARWKPVAKAGIRDASGAPWLVMSRPSADAGHWMGDIEIDPFDSDHAMYVTGATIWETNDLTAADRGQRTHWHVDTPGLEETVVLDLISPPTGAHLISAVGDIGGFVHEDLYAPPVELEPKFTNTESLDYAGRVPDVLVRAGTVRNGGGPHGAYSVDAGKRWRAFPKEPGNSAGGGTVAVAADGKTFVWAPRNSAVCWSTDQGATWTPAKGLGRASRARPVADKVDAHAFYVVDTANGHLFVSHDDAKNFVDGDGHLDISGGGVLRVAPDKAGDLWFGGKQASAGLQHSSDGGKTFNTVAGVEETGGLGFGKAAAGSSTAALYLAGKVRGTEGIFRSDDNGQSWIEISDPQHEFSNSSHITGDPRLFGRVYVGTPGRGILIGDIATDASPGSDTPGAIPVPSPAGGR